MSLPWLSINPRLQDGVQLINSLPQTKFSLLLQHVVSQPKGQQLFTEEQLQRLGESLKLDQTQLHLLISSIAHILKQSLKVILKPTALHEDLVKALRFDAQKAEDFVQVWTAETKKDFDLENSKRLERVAWELDVQSAETLAPKEALPKVRLQMGLSDVMGTGKEPVTLELDEDELLQLYSTLEFVQAKLDLMQ